MRGKAVKIKVVKLETTGWMMREKICENVSKILGKKTG